MNKYRTHLIIDYLDSINIRNLEFDGFNLTLLPEPSKHFWQSNEGGNIRIFSKSRVDKYNNTEDIPENELIIHSENEHKAEDILSAIYCGILLAYPEPTIINKTTLITEYDIQKNEWYQEKPFSDYYKRLENTGFGCKVAMIAMKYKEVRYAIEKYKVSIELDSFSPNSAHPKYGSLFENYPIKYEYHTRSAFAIISAFSVVEELGLEIRSSSKNPRFIDSEKGIWNPKVYNNLTARLNKIGIKNDLTIDWIYRGKPTEIEKIIKPFFGKDSEWVKYGKNVRDKSLTFPEAIHNASYLRNFIAAHKFNELTKYISPYDVFNVQGLARKLVLYKMGLWETMLNEK